MRCVWLFALALSACAHVPNMHITEECPDGSKVVVMVPKSNNHYLSESALRARVKDACLRKASPDVDLVVYE